MSSLKRVYFPHFHPSLYIRSNSWNFVHLAGTIPRDTADQYPFLNIAGLVGSIDNDMCGTDLTIGADSALHRIIEAIDSLSSTANSHQRAFVIEVMGRNCGWLALMSGLATGADWICIPENPIGDAKESWETAMCHRLTKQKAAGKRSLMVIVAEGAIDRQGLPIKSDQIRQVISDKLNVEARVTVLGHVQRGGLTSSFDRYLGTIQGADAVKAVLESTADSPSVVIGIGENKLIRSDLMECVKQTQAVAKAIEKQDFDEAMNLRGTDYKEAFQTFLSISSVQAENATNNLVKPLFPVQQQQTSIILTASLCILKFFYFNCNFFATRTSASQSFTQEPRQPE